MQYTIEARELTHHPPIDSQPRRVSVEAPNADDAIAQFVEADASELVSFLSPRPGNESIATVRKNDSVFLVRVYAA